MKRYCQRIQRSVAAPVWAVVWNLLLAYITYGLARLVFYLLNRDMLAPALAQGGWLDVVLGGLVFDTSAIVYTNALWLLLMLLPLHIKENATYHRVLRWLFVVVNGLALVVNLCDAVYFPFTMRRTTSTVLDEFANESNLFSIVAGEVVRHWYLVLLAAAAVAALWRLYFTPRVRRPVFLWAYYPTLLVALPLLGLLSVAGMRGGFTTAVRPITVSNANQYVSRPMDAALVLNTPFSLIRTLGKNVFRVPDYYPDEQQLAAVYTPVHRPCDSVPMVHKNVVVIIVESFGREYVGALNRDLDGGNYRGYTPFTDSLISRSVTFTHSYANGHKSIDGMPSILSSIPMMVEPFFLTPAAMNQVSGLARVLHDEGYQTAFFHGAQNGSMGFQAFARTTGFDAYYGRTEFDADPSTGGDADFDGTWAIWDEPFLQYYCRTMGELREPFMTAVFTASSHHPFVVPEQYVDSFPAGTQPIHRCIGYTDHALRRFFEAASRQPWFNNTIFVLTADHTNMSARSEYQTDLGEFSVPIIIYDPSGDLPPAMEDKIAQQIDILPTLLGLLHYGKPYFAFGIDVLHTPAADTWAFSYLNGVYQYAKDGLFLQWDGQRTVGLYSLDDRLMQHNLAGTGVAQQAKLEREVKALIQQYMMRMTADRLRVD